MTVFTYINVPGLTRTVKYSHFIRLDVKCIGEEYDFSPPTVSVYTLNSISPKEEGLAKVNIDWEYDEKYNKETNLRKIGRL